MFVAGLGRRRCCDGLIVYNNSAGGTGRGRYEQVKVKCSDESNRSRDEDDDERSSRDRMIATVV
jgi:hypothetical protein